MHDPWARHPPGRFSRREVTHLLASIAALTVAFVFVQVLGAGGFFLDPSLLRLDVLLDGTAIAVAVVVVVTGFLLHELAHKFVAQHYGHWSEFRASYANLGAAVLCSCAGFLLAAPGAVNIVGDVSKRENGIISAVGPLVNVAMAALFIPLWRNSLGQPVGEVFFWAAVFNVVLAAFNLIPKRPLDGSKVIRWNAGVWLLFVLVVLFELKALFPAEIFFLP